MDENAKYSISMNIEGMRVPGIPPGVGDRSLTFTMDIDPGDLEAANELWYGHLKLMFGDDQAEGMANLAKEMTRRFAK